MLVSRWAKWSHDDAAKGVTKAQDCSFLFFPGLAFSVAFKFFYRFLPPPQRTFF